MRFEIRQGMRRIGCTISDEALEAVAVLPSGSTAVLRRRSFERFRTLIDSAAKRKLGTLPAEFSGILALSADELRAVPTTMAGSADGSGSAGAGFGR